jgi:hypothetical protein
MPAPDPGSDIHRKLLTLIRSRLRNSEDVLSARQEKWRRSERSYRLFVDPSEVMNTSDGTTSDPELLHPYPTSIVVPLSYALTQTLVSFWLTLFTNNRPYFMIDPADQNSEMAAKSQELLLTYQLDHVGWVPTLYQALVDACRYGIGIMSNTWEVTHRIQTTRQTIAMPGPVGPIQIPITQQQQVLEYEGNMVDIVDPFTWRPDPRWPSARFQRGSFCGETMWRSLIELRRKQDEGIYSNIDQISRYTAEHMKEDQSDRDRISGMNSRYGFSVNEPNDALVMVEPLIVDIVPDDYLLSPSQSVERWLIVCANRSIIIRAEPYPYDHQDFNYTTLESSMDLHSLSNPGLIEIMEPMHQHISWFINSMIENARKSLNDRVIYDPSIVNMDDVMNPSAGKAIRLTQEYWGIPGAVDQGARQLKVEDISKQNMSHVGFLIDLLQRVAAANETLQGQPTPEEKTATEISSMANQGSARLRTQAKLFSATGLVPLARQMVQNNQQLMTQPTYLKIMGSLATTYPGVGSQSGISISPEDIQGLFQFPVSDASQPLDPVRYARTWVQIMQMSMSNPAIAPRVNHLAVWAETLKSMGITDPSKFILPQQVQVMPDQQVQQQVQQGNLVPQQPGGAPPIRAPIPAQPQMQSVNGEENRPH